MSFFEITLALFQGFFVTLKLFGLTLLFALPLGFLIAFGSMSKYKLFSLPSKTFVWIIRGTPLMLQIIVVFYVPGILFNYPIFKDDRFLAALITFVINYAAYFSEIYRGGIESIPRGQYEAGQVLGLTKTQTFFKVVLMQVVKNILPPMSNEIITLVKDTSLIRVIAIVEIIKAAERFIAKEAILWPLFYTGVFYLLFCGVLTLLFNYFEKKLDYYKT
ncbi:MAG: L-cystine transport system permease protein TcyB [Firmicutes bacterium ADurb.Bin300]|jgi:polar amino acid transport system permease protein|nr:MAG: L-cystine transport system permease protein TcyB [Firmicutes bacterium ADurb.Bin300]HOD01982.1 amino acid ABC transporter permease [Clostridiales bacterium]